MYVSWNILLDVQKCWRGLCISCMVSLLLRWIADEALVHLPYGNRESDYTPLIQYFVERIIFRKQQCHTMVLMR